MSCAFVNINYFFDNSIKMIEPRQISIIITSSANRSDVLNVPIGRKKPDQGMVFDEHTLTELILTIQTIKTHLK